MVLLKTGLKNRITASMSNNRVYSCETELEILQF